MLALLRTNKHCSCQVIDTQLWSGKAERFCDMEVIKGQGLAPFFLIYFDCNNNCTSNCRREELVASK